MHMMIKATVVALASVTPLITAPAATGTALAAQAQLAQGSSGQGNCYPVGLTWVCVYNNGGGGSGGSGGGGTSNCTYTQASPAVIAAAGVGPPNPGYQWDIMTCPGQNPGPGGNPGQLVQVSIAGGVPAVTPFQLMQIAVGELYVPTLAPVTAPPRGRDGLVGLPEWFWVAHAQWQPVHMTVTAGPVWATATATPHRLTFHPGGGFGTVSCTGPGPIFNRSTPASQQHTSCSYTYSRSSDNQPNHAYPASLGVIWTISWTGSGGTGGVITNGYLTDTAFNLRVAQAEAVLTTPLATRPSRQTSRRERTHPRARDQNVVSPRDRSGIQRQEIFQRAVRPARPAPAAAPAGHARPCHRPHRGWHPGWSCRLHRDQPPRRGRRGHRQRAAGVGDLG
jgi:hypothetical protein